MPFYPTRTAAHSAMAVNFCFNTLMLVPTGIGASIGGFAGDASQAMHLLASVSDRLITHPNVANAGVFQKLPPNVWYVEGYALDQWMQGRWALSPRRRPQAIGILLDAGIPDRMRVHTLNTIHAISTVYGIDIIGIQTTRQPVQSEITLTKAGCSQGNIYNPDVLIEAGKQLLNQGASAIAVGVYFPDAETDVLEKAEAAYKAGKGLDPIGGLEALISHTLVHALHVPCAHAPVLSEENSTPEYDQLLDPRVASEYIAPTFLPCVLTGLTQAPDFFPLNNNEGHCHYQHLQAPLTVDELDAVVVPANALGSIPVLEATTRNIAVIAVRENATHMAITEEAFSNQQRSRLYCVNSYVEAAGLIQALKLGLPLASGYLSTNLNVKPPRLQKADAGGLQSLETPARG